MKRNQLVMSCLMVSIMIMGGCNNPSSKKNDTPTSKDATSEDTHIGKLEFTADYPTDTTVQKLYDEIDFQRACQAYIWAIPTVSINELI